MWFLIGIVVGIAMLALAVWMRIKNVSLTWYEWLIGIAGFLLVLFTLQNVLGLFVEVQPQAAWLMIAIIGLPGLILLAVAWQLAIRRYKAT